MLAQKSGHRLGFVRREIIDDEVDLAPRRLGGEQLRQKSNELGTGMARAGLAQDLAGGGVEGGIKREGAMTKIL